MAALTGGRNLGTASGSIIINTSQLRSAAGTVRQAGQQMRQSLDQTARGAQNLGGAFRSMGSGIGAAVAGFVSMRTAMAALDLARQAAQAERTAGAFVTLSGNTRAATENLRAINEASNRSVSQFQAMRIANQAMALGLANSSEEMARLTRAARAVTFVSPVISDISSAITELALASANLSFRRLDQLGLTTTEVRKRMEELRTTMVGADDSAIFLAASVDILNTKYAPLLNTAGDSATTFEQAAAAWADFRVELGKAIAPQTVQVLRDLTDLMRSIPEIRADFRSSPIGQFFLQLDATLGRINNRLHRMAGAIGLQFLAPFTTPRSETIGRRTSIGANIRSPVPTSGGGGDAAAFSAEQTAAIRDWARSVQQIERAAADARLEATEQYERQRTETIRSYEQSIAREAEDFARNRARQIAALERSIASVREDAVRREATAERDFGERVAEIRTDSQRRLAELEERFQRDRVRAERDHRDRLLDAAARLDAAAVFEQQRNFSRQQRDAEENFRDARRDIQDQLSEREEDERKSHQRRLQDARDADARRIDDMRQAFELQRQEEDEDRAIRLARQAEDFRQQLAQQDAAHQLRLEQINRHAARERYELDQEFFKELERLGLRNEAWYAEQHQFEVSAIRSFRRLWQTILDDAARTQAALGAPNLSGPRYEFPTLSGGSLPRTLPTGGASFTPSSQSIVPGNRNITVAPGAVVVNGAVGQSEEEIARIVEARMTALLNSLK